MSGRRTEGKKTRATERKNASSLTDWSGEEGREEGKKAEEARRSEGSSESKNGHNKKNYKIETNNKERSKRRKSETKDIISRTPLEKRDVERSFLSLRSSLKGRMKRLGSKSIRPALGVKQI